MSIDRNRWLRRDNLNSRGQPRGCLPKTAGQRDRESRSRPAYREKGERTQADRIRSSRAYQIFRAWFRKRHPVCLDPLGIHERMGTATDVDERHKLHLHHVIPLEVAPGLFRTESNCASLCASCHAEVERMERAGVPTADLFTGGYLDREPA